MRAVARARVCVCVNVLCVSEYGLIQVPVLNKLD